jgi:biotin carboxyl carrier protein
VTCHVEINGRRRRIDVERADGAWLVSIDGQRQVADVTLINGTWSLILGAAGVRRSYEIGIGEQPGLPGSLSVHVGGRVVTAAVDTRGGSAGRRQDAGASAHGPRHVTAPMPGKVVKLLVQPGHTVAASQGVVVVEAMKMENELRAPRAGTVAEVKVAEGASVDAGTVLVVIE